MLHKYCIMLFNIKHTKYKYKISQYLYTNNIVINISSFLNTNTYNQVHVCTYTTGHCLYRTQFADV